jgi:transketolase
MTASTGPAASLHVHTEVDVKEIARVAQTLRLDVLKMVYGAQSGHLGGAFSAAEIVASLYWHHLRIDPQVPAWGERDRFLLSKGHASALLYAALARRGFFPVDELGQFRHLNSRLNGHPDRDVPGVEVVAGPLGHGVAVGAGLALGLRMGVGKPSAITAPSGHASHGRVYVLLGDGELNAGIVWEGVMTAAKYRLGNLVAIVDCNGVQQTGATADVMPLEPLADKWRAFGWHVQEVDGHDVGAFLSVLHQADDVHARPAVILARTTKGRGVSFMEYDHRWHGGAPDREHYELALVELEEGLAAWSA